ncbi:MAG: hypothetical protein EXS17_00250 [Phycisphaerales bacterium]|nr:hypothetical protein [Phycisphaerales bacterium]
MSRPHCYWNLAVVQLCSLLVMVTAAHTAPTQNGNASGRRMDQARLAIAIAAQQKFDDGMSALASDPTRAQQFFQESASDYQKLTDLDIHNGELFFNLANALVQSGEYGRGIGALLDAQRLLPADGRVATNLAHARSLVSSSAAASTLVRPIDRIASYWTGSQWTSYSARLWGVILLWTALWLILATGFATGWQRRVHWRGTIATVAVLLLMVGATVAIDLARARMDPLGVVIHDGVIARKGNGDGFAPAFTDPLKEGAEFTMVELRPGWYRIELADGQSGWVKVSDAHVTGQTRQGRG